MYELAIEKYTNILYINKIVSRSACDLQMIIVHVL